MYTVELSLLVGDQCLWISWAVFTHEITSSSTCNKLIYGLAFNATNQCDSRRKLRLHESGTFWQSKDIDPTNKNYSTVIIRNVTGMNFLNFISFTLFEWGNGENIQKKYSKPILVPCKCRTIELPDWVTVGPLMLRIPRSWVFNMMTVHIL